MVSFGRLPANGSGNPTVNTNCQKFVWSVEGSAIDCVGACIYRHVVPTVAKDANGNPCGKCLYEAYFKESEQQIRWAPVSEGSSCPCPNSSCPDETEIYLFQKYFGIVVAPTVVGEKQSISCYIIPSELGWILCKDCSSCSSSACKCLSAGEAEKKGLLPPTQEFATKELGCYKISTGSSSCKAGECDCPPPPTNQSITSSTQVITKNCIKNCGECLYEWSYDTANPCSQAGTCEYEFDFEFNWNLDEGSSCPCASQGFKCLSAQDALILGLLPTDAVPLETKSLSCYKGDWVVASFCNPGRNDCGCPPTPTPASALEGEYQICRAPTPTPSPTEGCGTCNYKWNATTCPSGNCVYTWEQDILQWELDNTCESGCICMTVDQAISSGFLPEEGNDTTPPYTLNCYKLLDNPSSFSDLDGQWIYTSNSCAAGRGCFCPPNKTPSAQGSYPNQKFWIDCINATATPTPTPTVTPNIGACASNCQWACALVNSTYKWLLNDYCTSTDPSTTCSCYPNYGTIPCDSGSLGTLIDSTCNPDSGGCTGRCSYLFTLGEWVQQTSLEPCIPIPPISFALNDWNNLDYSSYIDGPEPIFSPQAVTCNCNPPTVPGTEGETKLGTCGPDSGPVQFSSGTDKWQQVPQATIKPSNISPSQVHFAPINKNRAKLCKHAGKQPLEMVKQNCGACAIRKCDLFGLCTHTAVIDGRDDIYCCQICDKYNDGVQLDIEDKKINNDVTSINVISVQNEPSIEVGQIKKSPTESIELAKIPDSSKLTDDLIAENKGIKISPANLAIDVNVDNLLKGEDDDAEKTKG
jgi:hypothetical protein